MAVLFFHERTPLSSGVSQVEKGGVEPPSKIVQSE